MSACCDGHSLCDACQKIKNEAWEREHQVFVRRIGRGESLAAMMLRLGAKLPEKR